MYSTENFERARLYRKFLNEYFDKMETKIAIKHLVDLYDPAKCNPFLLGNELKYDIITKNFSIVSSLLQEENFVQTCTNLDTIQLALDIIYIHFDKFPRNRREKILLLLGNQPIVEEIFGYTLHNNFLEISKKVREELLIQLEAKSESNYDLIAILIHFFELHSSNTKKAIFRIVQTEKAIRSILHYINVKPEIICELPDKYKVKLFAAITNTIISSKSEEVKALTIELIMLLTMNVSGYLFPYPIFVLDLIRNACNELSILEIGKLDEYFQSLSPNEYYNKFKKLKSNFR